MKRPVSIWRYNLSHELAALVAAALILIVAVWFTLRDMHKRYLDARMNDVEKIHIMLKSKLDDAGASFDAFMSLPGEMREAPEIKTLFPHFADLFRLDDTYKVDHIYLAKMHSKVFTGYSFSGGPLARLLETATGQHRFSDFMRGHDDDAPSLYLTGKMKGEYFLGRLKLDFIESLLGDYGRFSGVPAFIVSDHGFMMAASNPELGIPSFDLAHWLSMPVEERIFEAGGSTWVPVVNTHPDISGNIVVLIPMELMKSQQQAFFIFLAVLIGSMMVLVLVKNARQRKLIVAPITRLAGHLRSMEEGRSASFPAGTRQRLIEISDIEERFSAMVHAVRQREQQLIDKEKRLENILGGLPVAVAITTLDEKQPIIYSNQLFHHMFGYSREELASVDEFARRVYPDEKYRSFVMERWRGEVARAHRLQDRPRTMEFTVQAADHRLLHVLFSTIILEDQLLVAMVDLTPLRESERKLLHAAQREAQVANRHQHQLQAKLKSSLAASAVAHEINPPLSSILLQCKLALQRGADYRPALEAISSEADRVIKTIEKMRALLRNVETRHEPVNLSDVVESAILQVETKLDQHGIMLRKSGVDQAWIISGDEVQLLVIISNLLRNAIEAVSTQSPGRLRAISVRLEGGVDEVRLVVGDSGPGWSGLELTQTPLSSTKLEGSGIGLYLVRTAATMHQAVVDFGSSSLGGAEARVTFPLYNRHPATPDMDWSPAHAAED